MRRDTTSAAGPFAMTVEDCRLLTKRILARVEDHLGIDIDAVNWGHVANADLALGYLKDASRAMGIEVDR